MGLGSGIRDPRSRIRDQEKKTYSGSRIRVQGSKGSGSRIPDLKTATKERGEKKFVVKPFL
jgi:hypothetical protein